MKFILNSMAAAILLFSLNLSAGRCIVYKEAQYLNTQYPLNTELRCYSFFKNNPPPGNFTFVAAPWDYLISQNTYSEVKRHIRVTNGITVCFHTQFEIIIRLLQEIGVKVLFTPHADKNKKYPITVLPIAHSPINVAEPAQHKDILYSFVGTARTHHIRKQLFQLPEKDDTRLIAREKHFFHNKADIQEIERIEYLEINARSRFGLCPRGYGPGTIRFWELLHSGTIPVVLNDALMLPDNFDWNATILHIPEACIDQIDTIIRSIDESTEATMRANCFLAYEQFCEDNIANPILTYIQNTRTP